MWAFTAWDASNVVNAKKLENGREGRADEIEKQLRDTHAGSALILEADCTWDVFNGIPAARFEEGRRKEAPKIHT